MKKKRTMAQMRRFEGFCFVLPAFIYLLIVVGYPLVYNFVLSFRDTNVKNFSAGTSVFVGFQNYITLFQDETFLLVLKNTFVFTIGSLFFQFTIGFAFALFFSKKFTLAGPVRGLVLVSYMMPMSVTALLARNMFGTTEGVINDIFINLGLITTQVEWLTSTSTAMIAVIAANCWVGIPFNMLLLTSGLTGIDEAVYESAAIDGATSFKKFIYVTLPLVKPAIMSVLMLGFIYTFKAFDLMYVMTSGGPLNSTDVLGTYSYNLSFTQYEFSLGAAAAMVLFACLFVVGLFYLKLIAGEDD